MNLIIHYSLIDMNITEDRQTLFDIAKAADFLHMEKQLDDACRCVAATLRGKTADEVRKFLGM